MLKSFTVEIPNNALIIPLVATFIKAYFFMWQHKPSRIISTGGLLAIPICIAAWLHGVKIGLYELNVVPGKATRLLARWATTLFITFEDSRAHFGKFGTKCVLTEYPVRFSHEDLMTNKENARENINTMIKANSPSRLPFTEARKTIFVLGGSQGSAFLNDLIKQWAVANPDELKKIQIIHQAGNQARNACEAFYAEHSIPALVFGYHHHIQDCYTLADVVISRAGAGTLFELAFFKKNSLIIPLAGHADNHQIYNAQAIQQSNPTIFTIFNQSSVTRKPQEFFKNLNSIINEPCAE